MGDHFQVAPLPQWWPKIELKNYLSRLKSYRAEIWNLSLSPQKLFKGPILKPICFGLAGSPLTAILDTLGQSRDHLEIILGLFWDYFGTILGQLWDNFGTTLGPLWDQFGTH